ncbi:MAG TPA: cupredoxin domain-containing protein [Candidatus Binatia bacterium]|nr:cupredoxin domain-containing protein [Candidatus Binatia bacterium]
MKRFLPLALLAALLTAPATASPSAPAIRIKDDAFTPKTLTIVAGQTVTFVNDDDDAHTVTAVDGSFDSKGLDTGGVWRHTSRDRSWYYVIVAASGRYEVYGIRNGSATDLGSTQPQGQSSELFTRIGTLFTRIELRENGTTIETAAIR